MTLELGQLFAMHAVDVCSIEGPSYCALCGRALPRLKLDRSLKLAIAGRALKVRCSKSI